MSSKKPIKQEHSNDDSDDNVPLATKKFSKKNPKQEPIEDDDDDNLPLSRSKPKKPVKKEPKHEPSSDDDIPISRSRSKKQPTPTAAKKKVRKVQKGAKKVYALPGQKHDPPEERDPLRIFYESLYQQMPSSDMATVWMMEWGLLPSDEAAMVFEKKRNLQSKLKSPAKTPAVLKTVKATVKKVKKESPVQASPKVAKKRKACDDSSDESDDDFFLSKKKVIKKQKVST